MANLQKGYAPAGKFLWDAWFIKADGQYHLFHLQANRVGLPEDRHHNHVSIGHAVSSDLKNWQSLSTPLEPGSVGKWDDVSLWTGSVFKKDDLYYLFYTARNHDQFWVQCIGVATSPNLRDWKKHPANPLLAADNHFYDMKNEKNSLGVVPAFRDPYIFEISHQKIKDKKYYMIFCARAFGQPPEYNGCIGIAESKDLFEWKLLPPLLAPYRYDEMEVPQLLIHQEKYYLFFTTYAHNYSPEWRQQIEARTGLHCYVGDSLFGKYQPLNGSGTIGHDPQLMGLRLIEPLSEHEYLACGWINNDEQGNFVGRLSATMKIVFRHDFDSISINGHSHPHHFNHHRYHG